MSSNGPSKYNPFNWNFFSTPAPVEQTETAPEQTTNPDAMEGVVETAPVMEVEATPTVVEQTPVVEQAPTHPSLMRRMSQRTLDGLAYARNTRVGNFAADNAYPIVGGVASSAGLMAYDYFRQQNPVSATVVTLASLATTAVTVPSFIGGNKLIKGGINLAHKAKDAIQERLAKKKRTAEEAHLTDAVDLQAQVQSGNVPEVGDAPVQTQTADPIADLALQAVMGQQPTQAANIDDLAAQALQIQAPTFTPVADDEAPTNKRQKRSKKSDVGTKAAEEAVEEIVVEEKKKPAPKRRNPRRK